MFKSTKFSILFYFIEKRKLVRATCGIQIGERDSKLKTSPNESWMNEFHFPFTDLRRTVGKQVQRCYAIVNKS